MEPTTRTLKEKYMSMVLQQAWFALLSSFAALMTNKLPAEYYAAVTIGTLTAYSISNYKKHQLYVNGNGANNGTT